MMDKIRKGDRVIINARRFDTQRKGIVTFTSDSYALVLIDDEQRSAEALRYAELTLVTAGEEE